MPINLRFSESDIAAIAADLQIDLSTSEKIAVLKANTSCDVQAGPGCGKTTTLTAKLALLSQKWCWSDRGILVLSHTNVARKEIEARLTQSKALTQLLGYPHFIGTFQAFVDQFLALPYLRTTGIEATSIDDEKFAARSMALYEKGPYWTARNALSRRHEPLTDVIGKLSFDGAGLRVTHPHEENNKFPSGTSETGKQLSAIKNKIAQQGYFRFDDMYAYAETCLAKRKYLLDVIRHRFPWVFVDELQDVNRSQDRIIETLFDVPGCVIQRFGDKNQAIFNPDTSSVANPALFGRRPTFPLSETHRFSGDIARFASPLTVIEPQTLKGVSVCEKRKHTAFIFERDHIGKVLPAFADLVLLEVPSASRARHDVCVIAGRKNIAVPNPKYFPEAIGDYWGGYRSDISSKARRPDSLYGFVTEARRIIGREKSTAEGVMRLTGGVVEMVRLASAAQGTPLIKSRIELVDCLKAAGLYSEFKLLLWNLLRSDADLRESAWHSVVHKLSTLLSSIVPTWADAKVFEFLQWSGNLSASLQNTDTTSIRAENTYAHSSVHGELSIRFDTIHAVKGETHSATLIVETCFSRTHDIKSLLPVLTGAQSALALTETGISHCKRLFVGMTRPTELLCLAIYAEHVKPRDIALLQTAGWRVQQLCQATR